MFEEIVRQICFRYAADLPLHSGRCWFLNPHPSFDCWSATGLEFSRQADGRIRVVVMEEKCPGLYQEFIDEQDAKGQGFGVPNRIGLDVGVTNEQLPSLVEWCRNPTRRYTLTSTSEHKLRRKEEYSKALLDHLSSERPYRYNLDPPRLRTWLIPRF